MDTSLRGNIYGQSRKSCRDSWISSYSGLQRRLRIDEKAKMDTSLRGNIYGQSSHVGIVGFLLILIYKDVWNR